MCNELRGFEKSSNLVARRHRAGLASEAEALPEATEAPLGPAGDLAQPNPTLPGLGRPSPTLRGPGGAGQGGVGLDRHDS